MTILLSIDGLQKRFGERLLLDIGRLDIAANSAYVLTGLNGVGKSTLLRILAGWSAPISMLLSGSMRRCRFRPMRQRCAKPYCTGISIR